MKPLETRISNFDNWSLPWTFHDFVVNSPSLTDKDKELFKTIWGTAIENINWMKSDLSIDIKATEARLKELFELDGKAISIIVRAASYEMDVKAFIENAPVQLLKEGQKAIL